MSTELVKDNTHIFRAFSKEMHNDNLEEFVKTRHPGQSSVQGAYSHCTE